MVSVGWSVSGCLVSGLRGVVRVRSLRGVVGEWMLGKWFFVGWLVSGSWVSGLHGVVSEWMLGKWLAWGGY